MIEIPIEYLLWIFGTIGVVFVTLWTAVGVYFIATREVIAGIIVLGVAVVFWTIVLTMLEIVVWV